VTDRALFGDRLRRARERRKLTLQEIAGRTKISASMLASLEKGECNRWPVGVYSRSYVRSYAESIGLDPAETLAEFVLLFPHLAWTDQDHAAAVVPASIVKWPSGEPLRLTIDEAPVPLWRELLIRLSWRLHALATGGARRLPDVAEESANEPAFGELLQLDR
jgi:transcriptional regulator with XRE-family HTH domain